MDSTTPDVVKRYFAAADAGDVAALAGCFTDDGTVVDEDVTYTGQDEIAAWRTSLEGKWTYTTQIVSSRPLAADDFHVTVHIKGNFPGREATLAYEFGIRDDRIAALGIAP